MMRLSASCAAILRSFDQERAAARPAAGTITPPLDMTVLNETDGFHLVADLTQTGDVGINSKQQLRDKLVAHKQHIHKNGRDWPELRNWQWSTPK